MAGIASEQELDNFLKTPLVEKGKQAGPHAMSPPPLVGPKPAPSVQSVQDLDSFLKTNISHWNQKSVTPLEPSKVNYETGVGVVSKNKPGLAEKVFLDSPLADVPLAGSGFRVKDFYRRLTSPSPEEEELERKAQKFHEEQKGKPLTTRSMADAADISVQRFFRGQMSPGNLALLLAVEATPEIKGIKLLTEAGFTAQAAQGAYQQAAASKDAFARGDYAEGVEGLFGALFSGGFAYGAGKAGVHTGIEMHNDVMARLPLDSMSQDAFGKDFKRLTEKQQAAVMYDLAKQANAPLSMELAMRMGKATPTLDLLPHAAELAEQSRQARRESAPFNLRMSDLADKSREIEPPPAMPAPEKRASQDVDYYELPETESAYLSPEERAQQYYTLESARARLDEERNRQEAIDKQIAEAKSQREREALDRRQQAEGEERYRQERQGKVPVVRDRRGLEFDQAGAQQNRAEYERLSEEMNRIAEEHMYADADDMLRSIGEEKGRGRKLEDWKNNILETNARRREFLRLSDPRALAPKKTEVFQEMREDGNRAVREQNMRDAAEKLEREAKNVVDPGEFEKRKAEAEEARSRAEEIRTERDKAAAARAAQTAERQVYPLGVQMAEVKGKSGEIILPDRRRLSFHYAVVPLDQLMVSHDPLGNFDPVEEYPEVLQPRDYKNNKETQAGVIAGGRNIEPSLLMSDTATPADGPPIVRADGVVAGGNGRTMRMKLAYKNGLGEDLAGYLAAKAEQFGIDASRIQETKDQPVLVRVLDDKVESAEDLARLGRDLNRTETMGFSDSETAVTAGRAISADTLDWVTNALDAMGEEASLRDFMRRRGNEIVERMVNSGMIEPTKRAEFITSDGEMTEKAKDLFEAAMLGKVIDDPALLATTPREVLRKLERSVAALVRIKDAGGLWDITPELQQALSLWKRVDSVREGLNLIGTKDDSLVDKYLHPGDYKNGTDMLIDAREVPHPTVEAIAKTLEKSGVEVKKSFTEYADDAEGKQITIGPPPNPVESFNRFIGERVEVEVPADLWGVVRTGGSLPSERVSGVDGVRGTEAGQESPAGQEGEAAETEVTEESLRSFLKQHPGTADVADEVMDAMGVVVKNATGQDMDAFVRNNIAEVKGEGEPSREALGQDSIKLAAWAKAAGKGLSVKPFGEQMDIFGGAEPQYLLRNSRGQEALVLRSQLADLRNFVPVLKDLIDDQGNLVQSRMFDEPPTLGAPEEEIEPPPQGRLFQTKKGATEFLEDGRAVVYLFKTADASTFLHEFFHTMRRYLKPEDTKVLEGWLKVQDGRWSRDHEEKAARAFEYYHREAKAETLPEKVKAVFAKIQKAMKQIYASLKGSPLVKPSKEVSALFDRWYGLELEAPPGEKPAKYKYGNTQADVPRGSEAAVALNAARSKIDKADLTGDGKDIGANHVTVRYGINGEDVSGIKRFLSQQEPFQATLGKTDKFPPSKSSDGAAPIIAPIDAPELHRLNKELEGHGVFIPPTFSEYRPHATVAYVKPEAADKYVGMDDTEGKKFTIDRVTISHRDGTQEVVKFGSKLEPERIKPAAELEAPPVTAAERESAIPIGKAGAPLDTEKIRTKVFKGFEEAKDWAFGNKDKIKGAQLFKLPDGRVVVDFAAKNEKVLFQISSDEEAEIGQLNLRLAKLRESQMRMMPDAQRAAIAKQIHEITDRRNMLQAKRNERSPMLEPPPGQVLTLWTPEGERPLPTQPSEDLRGGKTQSDVVRTVFDEPPAVRESRRPAKVSERAESPGLSRAEQGAGGRLRPLGERPGSRGSAAEPRTALRDVSAIRVAEPIRPRGEAAYSTADWSQRVKDYKLPENAPAPTVRIPKEISRMLMPGQTEVVESVLSGLKQHDAYILATQTGTGKTYVASAVLQQKLSEQPDARVLVITPSKGLINGDDGWIQVANNFGVEVKAMTPGDVPQEPGVWIGTWSSLLNRPGVELQPWDLVIADEVQEARRWFADSKRGMKLKEMGGNAKKMLYMSATPFHTALEIGHMDKLGLWRDKTYESWAKEMGVYRDQEGNLAGGRVPMKLSKLRQQLIERGQMISLDRQMEGYAAHFGVVPMDSATAQGVKNIAEAMKLAERYFQSIGRLGKIRPTKAQAVTLAKRWLEWQRLPHAIELGKKLEKQGWKVLFFSENKVEFDELFEFLKEADEGTNGKISKLLPQFGAIPEKLQEAFGDDMALFFGPHSAAREAEKNAFMSNQKKHLFATYGAGGVGVSLHDKMGDYPRAVIYLGPPWSGVTFDQALGRPWRYGTKSNVRAYFLFSNAAAEMDIVTNKVAPRMESLRASVSGIDFEDPVVKNLRNVPENKEAALDYDFGNEHATSIKALEQLSDRGGVHNYTQLPVVHADEAKNKGMKLPGDTGTGAPSVVRLWQGENEEEVTPPEFDVPEVTRARATNISIGEGFIQTGAAPGRVDLRSLTPPQRRTLADAVMARAEAAARETPNAATQAVYSAWENAMKQMDAFLSVDEGKGGGMEPPPVMPPDSADTPSAPGEIGGMKAIDMYMFTNGRDVVREAARIAGAPEVGRKIARNIEQYHVRSGEIAGPWSQRLWKLLSDNKLSKEEFRVAALTLAQREDPKPWIEKEIQRLRATAPMNERIARAVEGLSKLFDEVFNTMASNDIYTTVYDAETGKPRNVYFSEQKGGPYWPRRYDYDEKHTVVDPKTGKEITFTLRELTKADEPGGARKEQIIQGMMERHGLSRAAVEDWLASKKRQVPLAGNVERAREADLPFFRTDPQVVIHYLEDAAELLARKEYFAQDGSKAAGLIAQIPDTKARKIVKGVVDSLLSRQRMEPESSALLRYAADWAVVSKMTFASIKVLGHPAHGALLTNTRAFLGGLLKSTFDYRSARDAAMYAGSINEQVKIEQLAEFGIQKKSLASRMLQANLWQSAYKWGRVTADATARVFMERYALPELLKNPDNPRIRRQLREFMLLDDARVDRAIQNGRWLNEDVNWGGKALSDKVMFTNDPTELPPLWRGRSQDPANDVGLALIRTATLLKGYQFKTHALLKDAIWDEVKKGNFRPLIPFLTVYPILGQMIWSLSSLAMANKKHFQKLMDDKEWTPRKMLVHAVEDIAHMIGDTQLMSMLEAYLGGKIWLGDKIAGEYFSSVDASDAARTAKLPIEIMAAKTPEKRYKVAKRWATETFPAAQTVKNVYDLSQPPPDYQFAPLPYPQ